MEIATNDNQINILYIDNSPRAKQTKAYCQASGIPIREINMTKSKLTGTMITEIAAGLKISLNELVNRNHPTFKKYYGNAIFDDVDIIKIIQNHPDVMKQPIVMRGNRIVLVEAPTDVLRLTT